MPEKFSINLLPDNIIMMDKQASKLTWANKFSVATLLVLVTLTSATFGIRFIQNSAIDKDNNGIVLAQNQISDLKSKEAAAVLLKKRLSSIQALGSDNKKSDLFTHLSSLAPADTQLSLISVGKNGQMVISASVTSIASFENYLSELQNKDKTSDLVAKIELENLTKNRAGLYQYDISITPK